MAYLTFAKYGHNHNQLSLQQFKGLEYTHVEASVYIVKVYFVTQQNVVNQRKMNLYIGLVTGDDELFWIAIFISILGTLDPRPYYVVIKEILHFLQLVNWGGGCERPDSKT